MSRLVAKDRNLGELLPIASLSIQNKAGWIAAEWAVTASGLSHPTVAKAAPGTPADSMEELAEELDTAYFELQDALASGRCTQGEKLAAFYRARAASAMAFAMRGKNADAIYEAMHATNDAEPLKQLLLAVLGT